MKLGAALFLTTVLAFLLQDVIRGAVLMPAAYLGWLIGIYYRSIPQFFIWSLAVTLILFLILDNLLPREWPALNKHSRPHSKRGTLEDLSVWITRAPEGVYYKWLIANRLGRIARETLEQRVPHNGDERSGHLAGGDWHPSDPVRAYLEVGLNGSFADYPGWRRPWQRADRTPLDISLPEVLDFLEKQLGEDN